MVTSAVLWGPWASQVVLVVKSPPASEMQVRFPGWKDRLEKEMTTHSSVLAWRLPMDRGAWQVTVHGFTKSRTRLKQLSMAQQGPGKMEVRRAC